jgi:hypothetical protein
VWAVPGGCRGQVAGAMSGVVASSGGGCCGLSGVVGRQVGIAGVLLGVGGWRQVERCSRGVRMCMGCVRIKL